MLSVRKLPSSFSHSGKPTLVFVHGLLGSGQDWLGVAEHLEGYPRLLVDLPGHGNSHDIQPTNFTHTCNSLNEAIESNVAKGSPVVLVGYSLGARLLMYGLVHDLFLPLNVVAYFLEGGHFGLQNEEDRKQRLEHDVRWAKKFAQEPIEHVLNEWYQQAVFSSLNLLQRQELIRKRAHNNGIAVANMLVATSLAKQPYLLNDVVNCDDNVHYICGEYDNKFSLLAEQSGLSFTSIAAAGHNVHNEQPLKFAQLIQTQLKQLKRQF